MCDLNNFDVILQNTFLDAYEINIFYGGSKVKVCAKIGSKLVNLNVEYNFVLAEIRINLVVLVKELELPSFVILMFLRVSQGEPKLQGAKGPPPFILDSLNKLSKNLIDELPNALPPYRKVDHKIEVVFGLASPSKASYILKQRN